MTHPITYKMIRDLLGARQPFTGSTMTAESGPADPRDAGRLRSKSQQTYQENADQMVYVVRSYNTPIAWVLEDGTIHYVGQAFSPTTTKHQKLVREYLK